MKTQLNDLYGRRTTPGVKILTLVAIIFFGLDLACTVERDGDKMHADKAQIEQTSEMN
jgi:hypothetical protein